MKLKQIKPGDVFALTEAATSWFLDNMYTKGVEGLVTIVKVGDDSNQWIYFESLQDKFIPKTVYGLNCYGYKDKMEHYLRTVDEKKHYEFCIEKVNQGYEGWCFRYGKGLSDVYDFPELRTLMESLKLMHPNLTGWLDTIEWISFGGLDARFNFQDGTVSTPDAYGGVSGHLLRTIELLCLGCAYEVGSVDRPHVLNDIKY